MYTSAQALNEVLTLLNQKKPGTERVSTALALIFGLEGFDAEGEALIRLRRLILKLKEDVDNFEGDAEGKKLLKKNLSSFNGVLSFSQLHMTIDDAKKNWLKSDHLVGLMYMNMALSGKIEYEEAREECADMAGTIDDLRAQIAQSKMEDVVKDVLDRRLSQIRNVIDKFRFYGADGLEQYLMELIGQIVVLSGEIKAKGDKTIVKNIRKVVGGGLSILQKTSSAVRYTRTVIEEGKNMLRVLGADLGE